VHQADADLPIADGVEHPLDPAWIELQRLIGWIVCAVLTPLLFVGLVVTIFTGSLPTAVDVLLAAAWLAVVVALAWLAQRWPPIEYRYVRYRIDGQGIEIRIGVVWRRVISVPRSRVQHIDVAQGPLERRYGLASLSIYTAGTEHAKVDLPGVAYSRAVRIRDHLLPGREHGTDDGT
jgi:membrane protein YdbS with pleckstrin-like domain